jgi:hypothetical protein
MPLDMFERKYVRFSGECDNHNGLQLSYKQVIDSIPISSYADKFNLSPCENGLPSNFILKTMDWIGRINQTVPSYTITDNITFNTAGRAVPYKTFELDVVKANAKAKAKAKAKADIRDKIRRGFVTQDKGAAAIAAIDAAIDRLPPNPTEQQKRQYMQTLKDNGINDSRAYMFNTGIHASTALWTTSPFESVMANISGGRTRRKRRFLK